MAQSWRPGSEVLSCQSSGVWGLVQRGMKGLVFMPTCWACISLCHNTRSFWKVDGTLRSTRRSWHSEWPAHLPRLWQGWTPGRAFLTLWGSRREGLSPETSMPYAVHRRVLRSTFIIIHIFEMQLLK